jgi:hypothetical protein
MLQSSPALLITFIDDKFALLSQQMKTMEENIMRILSDHEMRIQKLEQPGDR